MKGMRLLKQKTKRHLHSLQDLHGEFLLEDKIYKKEGGMCINTDWEVSEA